MKQLYYSLLLALGLGLSTTAGVAQMSGTYTIKPVSGTAVGDFATLQEAADELMAQGVNGPVLIQIFSGIYVGKMQLDAVPGVSETNTIKFVSKSGRQTVTFESDGLLRDEINIDCPWVIIKDLSFNFNSSSINGLNLNYVPVIVGMSGEGSKFLNNLVTCYDCQTTNAVIGMRMDYCDNGIIRENDFIMENAEGFYVLGGSDVQIESNTVVARFGFGTAISDNIQILDNIVEAKNYGIRSINNYQPNFSRNAITMESSEVGLYGIHLILTEDQLVGSDSFRIVNNMISFKNLSTAWAYAIGVRVTAATPSLSLPVEGLIRNNSLYISSSINTTFGIDIFPGVGEDMLIFNNSIQMEGFACLAMNFASFNGSTWAKSDFNNVHKKATCSACYYLNYTSARSQVEADTGMDANSLELDPVYVSDTDLHIQYTSNNIDQARPNSPIPWDIDREPRAGNGLYQDIGADELGGPWETATTGARSTMLDVEDNLNTARIFPNPVVESAIVTLGNGIAPEGRWEVYDALGRPVRTGSFGIDGQLNVSELASGSYILQMKNENKIIHFVVQ